MRTGIVLAYGFYSPEKDFYRKYLDFIAGEIDQRSLESVIICGGRPDPQRPDVSEAGTCKEYLLSIKPAFTNYVLEDQSLTTNQNLEFAAGKIKPEDEIVLYGDLIRLPKIIWIAMHFLLKVPQEEIYKAVHEFAYKKDLHKELPGEFHFQNLTIVGYDFGRTKEETIRQIFATPLDVLALYNEEFANMDVGQRKKDLKLK